MHTAFPEALVDGYEALIPSLHLPDADDRHVLAGAIRAGAHTIVTNNLKDFPDDELSKYDIEAHEPDQFIVNTFQLHQAEAVSALRKMRLRYSKPPNTPAELLLSLASKGLVQTAAELKQYVDTL